MTAWLVLSIIFLVFALLLNFSIRADIKFRDGALDFAVKYMFFTVYPAKKKSIKQKDKKAKKEKDKKKTDIQKDKNKSDKAGKNDKNSSLADSGHKDKGNPPSVSSVDEQDDILEGEKKRKEKKLDSIKIKIEQGKIIWGCVKTPLYSLFKGIFISEFTIDFTAGGDDAYQAAMNYGILNAVVYNAISFIRIWFPITIKSVDINCDFNSKKSVYNGECSVRIKLGTALAVLLVAGFGILKNWGRLNSVGKDEEQEEEKREKSKISA